MGGLNPLANFCPSILPPSSEEFWNRIAYHTLNSKNLNSVHDLSSWIPHALWQRSPLFSCQTTRMLKFLPTSLCREGIPSESSINHAGPIIRWVLTPTQQWGRKGLEAANCKYCLLFWFPQTNCCFSHVMGLSSFSCHKHQESITRHR